MLKMHMEIACLKMYFMNRESKRQGIYRATKNLLCTLLGNQIRNAE